MVYVVGVLRPDNWLTMASIPALLPRVCVCVCILSLFLCRSLSLSLGALYVRVRVCANILIIHYTISQLRLYSPWLN